MATIETKVDGTTLRISTQGQPDITVRLDDLSSAMLDQAALHGLKQKIMDAAALSRDPETGRSATPAQKFEAMLTVYNRIVQDGEWNARAEAGESTGLLLVSALMRITGRTKEEVMATVNGWDKATQTAMRGDAAVAPVIAAIKAERTRGPKVDTKALLRLVGGTDVEEEGDAE